VTGATQPQKHAVCNTCTLQLVRLAYGRRWAFRLVREPLRIGMLLLGWYHQIDPRDYKVRTESCYGCMRFRKTALKEKSATFRWLNDRVNSRFDRIVESIVTKEELEAAKKHARESTQSG
jgi:hypothetical protein